MSRRASLPGADELFRSTTPALTAVRDASDSGAAPAVTPVQNATAPVVRPTTKGVRTTPRRRVSAVDRSPSGRESHAEKITVYLSPEELFDLDQARLLLRGDLGLAADRGRIVRESIAVIIADLEAKGEQSILARRLRGL
ncbi:MAG: cobyrinic acid a,c-diamide synthase [Candidatus Nanopelagicaceae bacterium]